MKMLLFVCRCVEPFWSYVLPIDCSQRNFWFFPHQIFRGGEKIDFQPCPHTTPMCKLYGNPLRDGWNPLYRNLVPEHTCIHTHNHFTAVWTLSGTTWVSRYQKKHSPTHIYRGHQSSLICFLHILRSMASSLFNLHALPSFSTISLQVFFVLPLGLAPSTSYSIHFFTQSLLSFCSTYPYHRNLFCCSTEIMSSNPCLSTLYLELYLVA